MQGWHSHDFWPRSCRVKLCHFVCFVLSHMLSQWYKLSLHWRSVEWRVVSRKHTHTHARTHARTRVLTRVALSRSSSELFVNSTWAVHELFLAVRDSSGMARTATHRPDEFTNSLRIVRDQNFEHFKILVPTWHAVTMGLRTLHASLRLVWVLARLELYQCMPQNRVSVSVA